MLARLTKEQISAYWPIFKEALDTIDLPITRGDLNKRNKRILRGLLADELICWAIIRYDEESKVEFHGFFITGKIEELSGFEVLTLLFYYRFPDSDLTGKEFMDAWESLLEFAKGRGFNAIVAYSNVESVINLAKKMGADSSFRVLLWDLK